MILRYTLKDGPLGEYLYSDIDGDWVKYEDHAAELATLRAENERLREALEPFARAHDGRRRGDIWGGVCFKQEALKKAKEALK